MGFLDSLFGGGTSGATKKGMKYTDDGVNEMLRQFRQSQENYQSDVASGRYNPDESLRQAEERISHSFDINSGNLAAKMGGYGYKRGDSNISQSQRNLSTKSRLEGDQLLLAIKDAFANAQDRGRGAVQNAAGNYANAASGAGSQYINYGANQEARGGIGGVLGGLSALFPGKPGGGQSGKPIGNVANQAVGAINGGAGNVAGGNPYAWLYSQPWHL